MLREFGIEGCTVVDLGCNGGHLLVALTTAGFKAIGVDVSAPALALAAETTPQAELHCADISDFPFASARTVTALGDVICYQIKDGRHALKNNIVLDRIYRVLAPGGIFFRHLGPRPCKPVSIPKSPCRTRLTYQPRRARKPRRDTALSGNCHRSPGQQPMAAVPRDPSIVLAYPLQDRPTAAAMRILGLHGGCD